MKDSRIIQQKPAQQPHFFSITMTDVTSRGTKKKLFMQRPLQNSDDNLGDLMKFIDDPDLYITELLN